MCTALTAALGLLATLAAGSVVHAQEVVARARMSLSPRCWLTRWFQAAGFLATLAVLAPPPGPALLVDVCTRTGGVLLAEGLVLIGGVVVLAHQRGMPVPLDRQTRPLSEDSR